MEPNKIVMIKGQGQIQEEIGKKLKSTKTRHSWNLYLNEEKMDVYLTHSKLSSKRTLEQVWRKDKVETVIGKGQKNIQWMVSVTSDVQVKFSLTLNKNWELSVNERLFADLQEAQLKENETDANDDKAQRQSLLYRERDKSVDSSLNSSFVSEDKLKDKLNESQDSIQSDSNQKQQSDATLINTTDVNFNEKTVGRQLNENFQSNKQNDNNDANFNLQQNVEDMTPSVSVIGDRKTFSQEVEDPKNTFQMIYSGGYKKDNSDKDRILASLGSETKCDEQSGQVVTQVDGSGDEVAWKFESSSIPGRYQIVNDGGYSRDDSDKGRQLSQKEYGGLMQAVVHSDRMTAGQWEIRSRDSKSGKHQYYYVVLTDTTSQLDVPLQLGSQGLTDKRDDYTTWVVLQNDITQAGYWKINTKKKFDKKNTRKSITIKQDVKNDAFSRVDTQLKQDNTTTNKDSNTDSRVTLKDSFQANDKTSEKSTKEANEKLLITEQNEDKLNTKEAKNKQLSTESNDDKSKSKNKFKKSLSLFGKKDNSTDSQTKDKEKRDTSTESQTKEKKTIFGNIFGKKKEKEDKNIQESKNNNIIDDKEQQRNSIKFESMDTDNYLGANTMQEERYASKQKDKLDVDRSKQKYKLNLDASKQRSGSREPQNRETAKRIKHQFESQQDKLRKLKSKTMQKLVETVDVEWNGESSSKKVLQLTEDHVADMTPSAIPKVIEMLDLNPVSPPKNGEITTAKMVIWLRESTHGVNWQLNVNQAVFTNKNIASQPPEPSEERSKDTLESLVLFLQKAIVPAAIKNEAIVIVNGLNSCALTNAMSVIASNVRKQNGGVLPFSLVCITSETPIWYKQTSKGTFANTLKEAKIRGFLDNSIKRWHLSDKTKANDSQNTLWFKNNGSLYEKPRFYKMQDLFVPLFENNEINTEGLYDLEDQEQENSYDEDDASVKSNNIDDDKYLEIRNRLKTIIDLEIEEEQQNHKQLQETFKEWQGIDIIFPKSQEEFDNWYKEISIKDLGEILLFQDDFKCYHTDYKDNYENSSDKSEHVDKWDLDPNLTHYIIVNSICHTKKKIEDPDNKGQKIDIVEVSTDEYACEILQNNLMDQLQKLMPVISVQALHAGSLESICETLAKGIPILFLDSRERDSKCQTSIKKTFQSLLEVKQSVRHGRQDWYTSGQIALLNRTLKNKHQATKKLETDKKLLFEAIHYAGIKVDNTQLKKDVEIFSSFLAKHQGQSSEKVTRELADSYSKILSKEYVYSANLNDINEAKEIVKNMHSRSKTTNREGLDLLLKAQGNIDIYNQKSNKNKKWGKLLYYSIVILSLLITIIAVLSTNKLVKSLLPDLSLSAVSVSADGETSNKGLAKCSICSYATTLFCCVNALLFLIFKKFDPINHWKRLRCAALKLSSEVWKQRSECGSTICLLKNDPQKQLPYQPGLQSDVPIILYGEDYIETIEETIAFQRPINDNIPENVFSEKIAEIRNSIVTKKIITDKDLDTKHSRSIYTKNQYAPMFHTFPESKKKGNKEDKNYDVMIEMEEKRLSTPMLDKSSSDLQRKAKSKEVNQQETPKYVKQTKKEMNQQIIDEMIETNHSVFYPEPDNKEKDDHHSKLTIDEQILRRIRPKINSYQKRMPKYQRVLVMFRFVFLAGSLLTALLAFFSLAQQIAIVAVFVTTATTQKEFNGTQNKLVRYNNTVNGLDALLMDWYRLSDTQKNTRAARDSFIDATERIINVEQSAWMFEIEDNQIEKKDQMLKKMSSSTMSKQ